MATVAEIHASISTLISDVTGIPIPELGLEKSLGDDLELDSLSIVEIVVAIGEKLSIRIPDEEIKNLHTVGDLVNYVQSTL